MQAEDVIKTVDQKANPNRATNSAWFFKTGPGQYGEGDLFKGLTVPEQRIVAKQFKDLPLEECKKLLKSPWHENRLITVFILVNKYEKGDQKVKKAVYNFVMNNLDGINNWDIVDSMAPKITGPYLLNKDRQPLYKLADSKKLWQERIAVISTFAFIRSGDFGDTLNLCEKFLPHNHDLMHKACGWMLREIGKADEDVLKQFLDKHVKDMPRTMLRYAIEKLPEAERKAYLAK